MLFGILLLLHSIMRYVALVAGLGALIGAFTARGKNQPYSGKQRALVGAFVGSLHLNFLIGLLLYVVFSPLTQLAFGNIGAAMKSSMLRFFFVEHPFGMLVGIVVASIGAGKIRRADSAERKYQLTLRYLGAALVIICASIPWPFYPAGRPLLSWPF